MERKFNLRLLVLTTAVLGASVLARAQAPQISVANQGPDPEDMKRGVARISLINGDVSVRRGDSGEWVAAVINAPLLTDDRVASGPNSRAEVQFDGSNILRMGGNAEVRLAQLESGIYHLEIAKGTVTYRVLRASTANAELDTPSVSVRPSREGSYRITVNDAGETEITARAGDVEVFTPRGSQWVYNGQTMMARGSASDPEFQMVTALSYDDWDRWNDTRDRLLTSSTSSQYVPQGVYGTEDLDSAGSWSNVAPYGNVWHPTVVAAGWSPYRYGRWVWEDYYGWVWVSYDSWGWAPYHYGRWFLDPGFGWCWYPGAFGVRHYWSPALVGFFGFGHGVGFGVGFGFGNVGWVPLAPFEALHPWWGHGFNGVGSFNRGINVTNVNVTNIYRNARVTNGIAAVSAEDFRGGHFNNIQRVSGAQVGVAGSIRGQMPVGPSASSRQFSDRAASNNVAHSSDNLHFFSRGQAPAQTGRTGQGTAGRPSGAAQQGQSTGFRRFGEPGVNNGATQNSRPAQSGTTQAPAARTEGIRRFGEPGSSQPGAQRPATPQSQNQNQRTNGWNSFGQAGSSQPSRQPYNPPSQTQTSRPDQRQTQTQSTPRQSTPTYTAPRQQSAPTYSAPARSAPPSNSGGGHAAPPSGGGHTSSSGGGHSSGGGGRHR
jgi:FecR protein